MNLNSAQKIMQNYLFGCVAFFFFLKFTKKMFWKSASHPCSATAEQFQVCSEGVVVAQRFFMKHRFLKISWKTHAGEPFGHEIQWFFFAGANFIALRRRACSYTWLVERYACRVIPERGQFCERMPDMLSVFSVGFLWFCRNLHIGFDNQYFLQVNWV